MPSPIRQIADRAILTPASLLLAGAVVGRLGTLIATVVCSRLLVPAIFGQVALIQTIITFAGGLAGLGLGVSITRLLAENRAASPELAGAYLRWATLATGIAVALVTAAYIGLAGPISALMLGTARYGDFMVASAVAVPATALLTLIQASLMGLQRFGNAAVSQAVQGVLQSVGLAIGAVIGTGQAALWGFSLGTGAAAALSGLLLWRAVIAAGMPFGRRPDTFSSRPVWRIGIPAFLAFLSLSLALLAGQAILAHVRHGYALVALFNVAYRWHLGLLFIPASVAPALLPMMSDLQSSGRGADARRLFRINLALAVGITAVPAALLIALAPTILGLSGEFYAGHAIVLIVLVVAAIPGAINNVLSGAGVSLDAVRAWLTSDLALAVAFLASAALLIPRSGATGLALAYLIGYIATDITLAIPLRARLAGLKNAPSPTPPVP